MAAGGGFMKYMAKAFLFHWNLLALGTGAALGLISGRPDVVLPLVAAGELVFLVGLATRPHFQDAVDAHESKDTGEDEKSSVSLDKVRGILATLDPADRGRYEKLKGLCLEMTRISGQVNGGQAADPAGIGEMHLAGLNRLLWLYLKLMASRGALERYFRTTSLEDIQKVYVEARERLEALGPAEEDDRDEVRRRRSLEETVETSRQRMENFEAVRDNYEFLGLETERLYAKIAHLAEMGINRQDADFLTHEIDVVSGSLAKTEKTLGELDYLTEFSDRDAEPPNLLDEMKKRRKIAQSH